MRKVDWDVLKIAQASDPGKRLYVVILGDGEPLRYETGLKSILYYTKGWAIKKARIFRGMVVRVEDYLKALRTNYTI